MDNKKNDEKKFIPIDENKQYKTSIIKPMEDSKNGKTKIIPVEDHKPDKTSVIKQTNSEKTIEMFEIESKEKKIDSGFYKDPISFEKTIQETDFDLKKLFPDRTKSGHLKINRNFLNDAEPFSLERLNQETKSISEGIFTGFNSIDLAGSVSSYKPLLFYGLPRKEISIILLNILIKMATNYPEKHFLYYTYT